MSRKVTSKQFNLFTKTTLNLKQKQHNFLTSVSNSGGILNFDDLFSDIERPDCLCMEVIFTINLKILD